MPVVINQGFVQVMQVFPSGTPPILSVQVAYWLIDPAGHVVNMDEVSSGTNSFVVPIHYGDTAEVIRIRLIALLQAIHPVTLPVTIVLDTLGLL